MKFFKFFEYAYLVVMCFFAYEAFRNWEQETNKAILYICFAAIALFMYFFKRNFRKRVEANNKQE